MNILSDALSAIQSADIPKILSGVTELRERIEIVHTPDFSIFLNTVVPTLKDILLIRVPIQFIDNDENKTRHIVLEIMSRFMGTSHTEVLKPFVLDILQVSMKVLQDDNEDNALIAQRIIFELHKSFRPNLETQVQVYICSVITSPPQFFTQYL